MITINYWVTFIKQTTSQYINVLT